VVFFFLRLCFLPISSPRSLPAAEVPFSLGV